MIWSTLTPKLLEIALRNTHFYHLPAEMEHFASLLAQGNHQGGGADWSGMAAAEECEEFPL